MTSVLSYLRLPRRLRPVAAFAVALTAAVLPGVARAEQVPSFVQDGTLTVCTNPTLPPMTFVKGQDVTHPEGFDIDVAQALATRWHARLSVITMDFTGLFPSLSAQRCGLVMSGIIRTPAREKALMPFPTRIRRWLLSGAKAHLP